MTKFLIVNHQYINLYSVIRIYSDNFRVNVVLKEKDCNGRNIIIKDKVVGGSLEAANSRIRWLLQSIYKISE